MANWPGSGNTLFSSKIPAFTNSFNEIALMLGLAAEQEGNTPPVGDATRGWLNRFFR